MKAVMPVARPEVLRERRRTGANRFDEMWEGVLHMAPAPGNRHRAIALRIADFFLDVWCARSGGDVMVQANVSTPERWDRDYRIPDVSVMSPERLPAEEGLFVRPGAVFEVRSPGDETHEKLPFYAAVGVEAVVVVERDTRAAQVHARAGASFVVVPPSPDGWTPIDPLGVEVRSEARPEGARLLLRLRGEPASERAI